MTTTTKTNQGRIRSPSLAKFIKIVKQANERTAEQYEYRLSKFEKYLAIVITIVFGVSATALYYVYERIWNGIIWGTTRREASSE